jgi:Flp pilus assembly protein TadG
MRGIMSKLRPKFLKSLAKSESGAAAVEFALVVFPFIYVMGTIIEGGIMMFTEYSIQAGVTEASRQLRTGQAQTTGMTSADFKSRICNVADALIDCGALSVYVKPASTFAALKAAMPSYLNVGTKADGTMNPENFACGTPQQAVGIIATYDWTFVMPFMNVMGNINGGAAKRLHGTAVFRNEPFPPENAAC